MSAPRPERAGRLGPGEGPPRTMVRNDGAVRAALLLDRAMARFGLARPVLLVSGFWRSGATFVQERLADALGAKTVFEPLSPEDPRRGAALAERFPGDEAAARAYIPGPGMEGDALWASLDGAVTGRSGGPSLLTCRRHVGESFRRGIVVKDVRLQFNLGRVHGRYGVPVVHVRRHPCATVASLLAADGEATFGHVRLVDLMRGVADRLPPGYPIGEALLSEFDTDALSRMAAVWAVTERFADLTLAGEPWGRIVRFEDVVADPGRRFADLTRWLGRKAVRLPISRGNARTARPRERWRQMLSTGEVARIVEVVTCLYPEYAGDLARTV